MNAQSIVTITYLLNILSYSVVKKIGTGEITLGNKPNTTIENNWYFFSPISFDIWLVIFAMGILMIGNGLFSSTLGLRAESEGFPVAVTGMVASMFYAGYIVGGLAAPYFIASWKHKVVYIFLSILAGVTTLLMPFHINPWIWGIFTLFMGSGFAGIYVVCESWINIRASNHERGRILAVYTVVQYLGLVAGQSFLTLLDPLTAVPFMMAAGFTMTSAIPMLKATTPDSFPKVQQKINEFLLVRSSTLGSVTLFTSGLTVSAIFGIGPVYAHRIGMTVEEVALFITMILVGGLLGFWPFGWFSDRFGRRLTIAIAAGAGLFVTLLAMWHMEPLKFLLFLAMLTGGFLLPFYGLGLASVNDRLPPDSMVGASAALIRITGVGSFLGPVMAAIAMDLLGPGGFFSFLAIAAGVTLIFTMANNKGSSSV
ncbi:MAG: MFS transporter [Magnetococcales bacterium]|nr:MFS transporter [Magnetococcales bacterium]